MNKKNKAFLIMVIVCAISLIGCGTNGYSSKEECIYCGEKATMHYTSVSGEAVFCCDKCYKEFSESDEINNNTSGNESIDYTKFKASAEIQNSSYADAKIQIADVVFDQPLVVSEFMKKLDSSKITWSSDCDENEELDYNHSEHFRFYDNEDNSFSIEVWNVSATETSEKIQNCVVVGISIDHINDGVFYANGYGMNGENVPFYTEFVTNLNKDGITYEEDSEDGKVSVEFSVNMTKQNMDTIGISFDTGDSQRKIWYYVVFDATSEKALYIEQDYPGMISWVPIS